MTEISGVLLAGSAIRLSNVAVVALVVACGVIPVVASAIDDLRVGLVRPPRGWFRRGLLIGELLAAIFLVNASRHMLASSVCVQVAGHGPSRVLAVSAAPPSGCPT